MTYLIQQYIVTNMKVYFSDIFKLKLFSLSICKYQIKYIKFDTIEYIYRQIFENVFETKVAKIYFLYGFILENIRIKE